MEKEFIKKLAELINKYGSEKERWENTCIKELIKQLKGSGK